MDLLVLDEKFQANSILDIYKSIIWTNRYNECGDFEIECIPYKDVIQACKLGRYLYSSVSEDSAMVIENLEISTNIEFGNTLKISGRSLECLLMRRIIWEKTILDGKVDEQIKKLIDDAIINPKDTDRKIENFVYKRTTDKKIQEMTIHKQFTGDNLYEAIKTICDKLRIGFRITLNKYNQLIFELFNGSDRSYEQIENPWVVFSTQGGNLTNSNNIQSIANWSTIALVAGEDEGTSRKTVVVGDKNMKGIDRRELFVDARDLQSETADGNITAAQYNQNLMNRGEDKLADNKLTNMFEGECESLPGYEFGKDYFIGDICQLENEYEMEDQVRIIEMIYSENESEVKYYPTFRSTSEEIVEDEEDEEIE